MISIKEIEQIIHNQWGISPISCRPFYQGGMNYIYAVTVLNQDFMLKVYPASRAYIADFEYKMLLNSYNNDIKVPKPVGSGLFKSFGFLIYHYVPGSDLQFEQLTTDQKLGFSTDLIKNLIKFSELPAPFFGTVTEEDIRYATWNSFLRNTIKMGTENLKSSGVISLKLVDSISQFLKSYQPNCSYYGMAWGDLKSENIIAKEGKLAAILDLESCFYGDPLISLGYLYAREGPSSFYKSAAESFGSFLPYTIEDIYYYALIRLLRISRYLKKPLPTGKTRDPISNYFKGINTLINDIL